MRTVALLQNESEMRHLVYGDATRALKARGFTTKLITAETVSELARLLDNDGFDAVVIGSNALNDKEIRRALTSAPVCEALGAFLERGRGLVCLHQMGLAKLATPLEFLPAPFDRVVPRLSPQPEHDIEFAPLGTPHPTMHFPEEVSLAQIRAHSRTATTLEQLWFHYWDLEDGVWATLLNGNGDPKRPLVALALDADAARRIVLCSIPVDWQRAPGLLKNLVHHACHGSRPPALVEGSQADRGLQVVIDWLHSDRVHLERYPVGSHARLERRLKAGVHETLLLAPGATLETDADDEVRRRVRDGQLRVLGFGAPFEGRHKLWIASARLSVAEVQRPVEALAVAALDDGYVDGSFWRTVEALNVLKTLPNRSVEVDAQLASRALDEAKSHQQPDGSYDGTLSATSGLLSLLHGLDKARAARAAQYLRKAAHRDDVPVSEALTALVTLTETGHADADDKKRLSTLLDRLRRLDGRSDGELLTALHGAELLQHSRADELTAMLIKRQKNGRWGDLEMTATAVERLVARREQLVEKDEASDVNDPTVGLAELDVALANASVAIRHAARLDRELPWAGRVATSLMCLNAIARVNTTLQIPVSETIDALHRGTRSTVLQSAGEAAAQAAESLRDLKDALRTQRDDAQATSVRLRERERPLRLWATGLGTAAGVLAWLLACLLWAAASTEVFDEIVAGIDDNREVVATVLVFILGIPLAATIARERRSDD